MQQSVVHELAVQGGNLRAGYESLETNCQMVAKVANQEIKTKQSVIKTSTCISHCKFASISYTPH